MQSRDAIMRCNHEMHAPQGQAMLEALEKLATGRWVERNGLATWPHLTLLLPHCAPLPPPANPGQA